MQNISGFAHFIIYDDLWFCKISEINRIHSDCSMTLSTSQSHSSSGSTPQPKCAYPRNQATRSHSSVPRSSRGNTFFEGLKELDRSTCVTFVKRQPNIQITKHYQVTYLSSPATLAFTLCTGALNFPPVSLLSISPWLRMIAPGMCGA